LTGIVGVNRDILGAGMGCKCIFNTDVFCFASPDYDGEIPAAADASAARVARRAPGVQDGGNQSGIPTSTAPSCFTNASSASRWSSAARAA
jgi:phosphoribosylformylglycinamidine synthase subunit PurSL